MKTIMNCFGFILIVLSKSVQCQMGGMMQMMSSIPTMVNGMRESQARSQLTPIVKYIVGETATPSPEMVNFAVIAGSSPATETERAAYLDMMKNVARRTPQTLIKFMKIKNGTYSIDQLKLDAFITKRAMQYSAASRAKKERKLKETERQRQQELQMLRLRQNHELELIGILTPNRITGSTGLMATESSAGFVGQDPGLGYDIFGTGVDPLMNSGTIQPVVEPVNHPAAQKSSSANVGTHGSVSLLDILRSHEKGNQVNRPSSSGTPQVTTPYPVPTAAVIPTGNPDMLNLMMFNGGMEMGLAF